MPSPRLPTSDLGNASFEIQTPNLDLQASNFGRVDQSGAIILRSHVDHAGTHTASHHASIFALMVSRISRVRASFCSGVPWMAEGSGNPQCNRVVTPGKIGQRSALVSSQ